MKKSLHRSIDIDFVRGIAVLMVFLHHAFQFTNEINNSLLNFIRLVFINYGQYGVELFFIISGYVIFEYYKSVNSIKTFLIKRITRILPMLLFSCILNLIFKYLSDGLSKIDFLNAFASLTLIDPSIFNFVFNSQTFNWLDPVFWTLFVEFSFYLFYGLIFALFRNRTLSFRLISFCAILILGKIINLISVFYELKELQIISNFLFFPQWSGWFLFGVLLSRIRMSKIKDSWILYVLLLSSLTVWPIASFSNLLQTRTTSPWVIPLFFSFLFSIKFIPISLRTNVARFFGEPSYVVYVLHLGFLKFMLSIEKGGFMTITYMLVSISIISLLSYLIHIFIEKRIIKWLRLYLA